MVMRNNECLTTGPLQYLIRGSYTITSIGARLYSTTTTRLRFIFSYTGPNIFFFFFSHPIAFYIHFPVNEMEKVGFNSSVRLIPPTQPPPPSLPYLLLSEHTLDFVSAQERPIVHLTSSILPPLLCQIVVLPPQLSLTFLRLAHARTWKGNTTHHPPRNTTVTCRHYFLRLISAQIHASCLSVAGTFLSAGQSR